MQTFPGPDHDRKPIRESLRRVNAAAAATLLSLTTVAHADAIPAHISAAVADPGRPEADRQRDADRLPAEVLSFAGIEPGDRVADFMPGKGYFTRLLCRLVGPSGHVYAISVPQAGTPPQALSGVAADPPAAPTPPATCPNVTATTLKSGMRAAPELWSSSDDPGEVYEYWASTPPAENFVAAEPLDLIWTSENYHDLHNERFGSPNLPRVNQAFFKALKPGGILMIEDHAAAAGSGARDTETLHRIDAEQVKQEVLAAGFVLVDESRLLHHPDDPRTARAHELRGRSDRFLLKFRKPAAPAPDPASP